MTLYIQQEIQEIDWGQYQTAYGVATDVPGQLMRLFSSDQEEAMQASHELWCGLCHQHVFISSAALPTWPFLVKAFSLADNKLTIELLDIVSGLALCTEGDDLLDWQRELRHAMIAESVLFITLIKHPHEEISAWAQSICKSLNLDWNISDA